MSSTTDFETLIAGAARGSPASLLQLATFLDIHHLTERQIERLLTALFIPLNPRHMEVPSGIANGEHYQPALLSLHCLERLVRKNLSCASLSLKLAERLTSFWPTIWSWIQLIHPFILNSKDFTLLFRLQAKNVALFILRMFPRYDSLNDVIQNTSGVVTLIFELWNLETQVYDFDPSNPQYSTAPAALTMNFYLPNLIEGDFEWHKASISAVGGSVIDVASVALTHLRHDAEQDSPEHSYTRISMDVTMVSYLSSHISLRNAILSQHSVLEITRVAVSLSSKEFSASACSHKIGSCLAVCFRYLLMHLTLGDVWTWTIQSLDSQLLRAILASDPWQSQWNDEEILLKLSDAITKNLTTRSVTLAAARAIKRVGAHELEKRFLRTGNGLLRKKWLALKELIEERMLLIPSDDESRNRAILKSCGNHMCRRTEETEGSFKRCGGCLSSHYCSSSCQKEHWKREHKSYCQGIQACRQDGAVCPWSIRDEQFMRTVMNNDLKLRHYEVHTVKRDERLDIVIVEFDYTVVPFKMVVGSLASCPLDDNGQDEVRAKWDRVLEHARKTKQNLIKRWRVPTGETAKLMMEAGNIICRCDDDNGLPNGILEIEYVA